MATQDPTDNYSWALPDVDGDLDTWGTMLNTIIGDDSTGIDTVVKTVSDAADAAQATADAALPKAGGTMTGEQVLLTQAVTRTDLGNVGAMGLDLDLSNHFTATATETVVPTVSHVPAGTVAVGFTLLLTNGGSQTLSWPAEFDWAGGSAPSLTASGVDLIIGMSFDNGSSWRCAALLDLK